ncbi:MAG: hypothetical protein RBT69_01560 [Spirochaetia bacterium]|nr:hypothetical protein [Spirochaetia bacterium]
MKRKNILLISIAVFTAFFVVYFAAEYYLTGKAEKRIETLALKADEFVDIKYGKVKYFLIKNDLVISDLVMTVDNQNKITIDKAVIDQIDSKSRIPSSLVVSLKEINLVNQENESILNNAFKTLGYKEEMPLEINVDYKYNKDTKIFDINAFEIFSKNAGKLTFSFNFSNISFEKVAFLPGLISEINPVLLEGASIKLSDNSITGKFLFTVAQLIKMDLPDFRKLLDLQIDFYAKQINNSLTSEISSESIDKLKNFIASPDEIIFIASPSEPVPLNTFYINYNKPIKLLNILNFQIR